MLRSLLAALHLSALAAAGTFGADAYDRVSPSVIDRAAPVVAIGGLFAALVLGVMGARPQPRGRRER